MRCIIGLGNPGRKYELTRHNIGFIVVDHFALKNKLPFYPSKYDYYYSEGRIGPSEFFLLKPYTYMNLSGVAVQDFLNEHPISLENVIVIVDDVYLPMGKIRIRKSGSDGGHNGLKSIIYHLQSESFPRLRIGVGKDIINESLVNFVLEPFSKDEENMLTNSFEKINELLESFIMGGYDNMLNKFSQKQNKKERNNTSEETY